MTKFTLIYDTKEEQTVQEKIVPAFENRVEKLVPFRQDDPACKNVVAESAVVTYVSDETLAEIVAGTKHKKWALGILPHPDLLEARLGFGIADSLADAIEDILSAEAGIAADLLLCNGKPVFNKVVIGNSLSLMAGSMAKKGFLSGWEKFKNVLVQSKALIPRAFTLNTEGKPPLKTAAIGIVAVLHGKSALLSRKLIKNSYINDGRMHCLVLAPRSIMQLLRFAADSVFKKNGKLPSFVGHIKAGAVTISSPTPMDFSLDNALLSAREIELCVSPEKLLLLPGRHLKTDTEDAGTKDRYRIKALPRGEAYLQEIVGKPLSLIYHASTQDFKELFKVLRENTQASTPFLTLMMLSTLLATLGLFLNSSPVIIGAMILAPLMAPIISLAMGVLRQDRQLFWGSLRTIGLGLLLSYLAAILVTVITPLQAVNNEISGRISPNLLDLGVAIVSGIAGAYAHAREEVAKTLAGVAIAVALVPPLAVSGIGIGWGDWNIFTGALLLFLTNLTGIVLAAAFTFMLLGFSPFHLAKKGLILTLVTVALVSLPLGFGFTKMVRDHHIVRSLNNYKVGAIRIRRVAVLHGGDPLVLNVQLVSRSPLSVKDIDMVKRAIASEVGRDVELEVAVSLRR
ncbi:DUF389 domain-containing protein [Botryobacter ruber]|uniref:DUF389 domain-containing protein n=1 Tax=Botryobacter ruber TaxID=2171629 RepID=UPI000E0B740B|nr:DUF389 domain-containing protein [Botryobacter ruber]